MTATLPASPAPLTEDQIANAKGILRMGANLRYDYAQALIAEVERHRSSPSAEWRPIDEAMEHERELAQAIGGTWKPPSVRCRLGFNHGADNWVVAFWIGEVKDGKGSVTKFFRLPNPPLPEPPK